MSELPTIRMATLADASEITRVHVAAWKETYVGLLPASMLADLSENDRVRTWQSTLQNPTIKNSTHVFLVEQEGKAIGFGSCGKQRTKTLATKGYDGEISAIYVLSAFQHRGLGLALMKTMAENLSQRGFGGLAIWVLTENSVARRFYELMGGTIADEKEEIWKGTVLSEVAYAWPRLQTIAIGKGRTDSSPAPR